MYICTYRHTHKKTKNTKKKKKKKIRKTPRNHHYIYLVQIYHLQVNLKTGWVLIKEQGITIDLHTQ